MEAFRRITARAGLETLVSASALKNLLQNKYQSIQEIDLDILPYGLTLLHYPVPDDQVDAYLDAIADTNPFRGSHQYVLFLVLPKGILSRYALYLYKIQPVPFYEMLMKKFDPRRPYQEITLTLDSEITYYYSHSVFYDLFADFLPNHTVRMESVLLSSWQYRVYLRLTRRDAIFDQC